MKRILWLVLLALLLCGCTEASPESTVAPTAVSQISTEPTEPAGIYVPFSDLEIQTGGSVRYFLPDADCYGIRVMGNDVLAFSGGEKTRLTRYAGQQLFAIAGIELDCRIEPEDPSFRISSNGITYYDPDSREIVFLDSDLKEVRRLGLSGDMVGKPVLSANRMQVYYCTAEAVRVYDTTTGLDKLLKTISYPEQSVEDILLNDTVLRCSLVDEKGEAYSIFLSVETGQMVSQILSYIEVSTYDSTFYAKSQEGIQPLLVYGRDGEDPRMLIPASPFAPSWFLEAAHALVTAEATEEATCLDLYDLSTGLRVSTIELPGGMIPEFVETRPDTGEILMMCHDELSGNPVLLSWDHAANPAEDDQVYDSPRYTAEDPDVIGLEACTFRAREMGEKYGVNILLVEDAIAEQPWDYTLEMEYQTSVVRRQLDTLDAVLSRFPRKIFDELPRKLSISIVRSIRGKAESGSLESAQGLQFWDRNYPYVVLAAGDALEGTFYHEFFHVMDSKILSDTRVYYHWNNLNPDGCKYFEDYTSYLEADVSRYLQEEDRAFIDAYSLSYPKEDRARIMEYACQEGNGSYFQSETMQNKLRTLCQGIRKAFGLEDYPEELLWEQYLQEPLTP